MVLLMYIAEYFINLLGMFLSRLFSFFVYFRFSSLSFTLYCVN